LLLKTRQVAILQTSLIGSILGGVILVTGASFFAGGLNRTEQFFNTTTATTVANFLMLSVASLIVPTASHLFTGSTTEQIAGQSRGTSIVLLLAYGSYVFFQLKSHSEVFGLGDGNMVSITLDP
jgi:Ca2+:H+ antiporter